MFKILMTVGHMNVLCVEMNEKIRNLLNYFIHRLQFSW
jgi:hypothetical protein